MEQTLIGRNALITGVSRRKGIGFAVADRLAAMGANVFCHALTAYDAEQPWGADEGGLSTLQNTLLRHGTRIEFMQADFADPNASHQVMTAALQAIGHIDILVANHAYSTPGALEEVTAEQIDAHLLINVRGSLLLVKAFPEVYEAVRSAHPQGRWGTPEDAARVIGWLVSDDASWITGQVVASRGGA